MIEQIERERSVPPPFQTGQQIPKVFINKLPPKSKHSNENGTVLPSFTLEEQEAFTKRVSNSSRHLSVELKKSILKPKMLSLSSIKRLK